MTAQEKDKGYNLEEFLGEYKKVLRTFELENNKSQKRLSMQDWLNILDEVVLSYIELIKMMGEQP